MISIVVAVYNGERFLSECLESLRQQTLHDLQFILVDDGSTDSSGRICDEYADCDQRFLAFHTENRGLCRAREYGIGIAAGNGAEYIGFADCDDWLEPDMYQVLLSSARKAGADVTECGYFREYRDRTETWIPGINHADTHEALYDLLKGGPHDFVWNKLWKTELLAGFRIPIDGAYADDISFTWRIYTRAHSFTGTAQPLYHYRQVSESIAHVHNMNLVNKWRVVLDRYQCLESEVKPFLSDIQWEQVRENQLRYCAFTAAKNWLWWLENPKDEREGHREVLTDMSRFVRSNVPPAGKKNWEGFLRVCAFLIRYPNRISLTIARTINRIRLTGKKPALY